MEGFKKEKLRMRRVAQSLSEDGDIIESNSFYVIYANGSRWILQIWCTWSLYWVPGEVEIKPNEIPSEAFLEYKCTWLPEKTMYKAIKKIIHTHPNLKTKGYWKLVKWWDRKM